MPIGPGQCLLHYRLVDKIGEGGMGEVWKAVDTNLEREVAIKLLPAAFAADPERLARFEREAKLLAALKHPNIAVVHGLHEAEGRRFLAMELAAGEDLARRLGHGRLSIEQAIAVARQVAEALEAAHEQGIVHRDLKPGNVQVDPEGTVKVLDFGLAKALAVETESGGSSMSPTVTSLPTAAGVLLGTAAYMSPEQARGTPVDKRSDIWAFGCLLYETLTGVRPFAGETISDTLAAVLRSEPDFAALPPATPAPLRALLLRCLTKDKRRRLRDIGEARIVLDDLERGVGTADSEAGVARPPVAGRGRIALGFVAIGALAFAVGYFVRPGGDTAGGGINPDVRVRRVTGSTGLADEPTISPEGNYVAYTSDDKGQLDVVVQPLEGGNVVRIADSEADDAQPAWSPDGSRIAFVSARERNGRLAAVSGLGLASRFVHGVGGDIFLAPAMGGAPVKLVHDGCYPAWSPDGAAIAFQAYRGGQWDLWTVPVTGGEPRQITNDSTFDYQPSWSPDGRFIAYGATGDENGLRIVAAAGGQSYALTDPDAGLVLSPGWSADGRWIFYSSDRAGPRGEMNLWRVPFTGSRPSRPPAPQRVTLGEGSDVGAAVSRDGRRLAYGSVRFKPDIWALDVATGALRPVTSTPNDEDFAHASPDGRRIIMESDRGGDEVALWIVDLVQGAWTKLDSGDSSNPRWSPDGRRVAYTHVGPDSSAIVVHEVGAVGAAETFRAAPDRRVASPEWSPDGTRIAFTVTTPEGSAVWVMDVDGKDAAQLTAPGSSSFPTWSPDGRTIAFQHEDGGPRQIWTVPAAGGEPRAMTDDDLEYSHPQWNPRDPARVLIVVDHKNLAVIDPGDGRVERLTEFDESTVVLDYPSWSANGATVYFSFARKTGDVYLLEGY